MFELLPLNWGWLLCHTIHSPYNCLIAGAQFRWMRGGAGDGDGAGADIVNAPTNAAWSRFFMVYYLG